MKMYKFLIVPLFLISAFFCYADINTDLDGNEFDVKTAFDLPVGNYIHSKGYYEDIYYNPEGYKGLAHDINRGFICDDYAALVKKTLAEQGYDVKIVSSSKANHAWNEVLLPDGRKVYVDVTWFDKDYDTTNRQWKTQEYDVQWIVFEEDKELFDHGFSGKVMKHYAFGDAQYK